LQQPEKTATATALQPVFLKPPVAVFLYVKRLQLQFFQMMQDKKTGKNRLQTGCNWLILCNIITTHSSLKTHPKSLKTLKI
jgi:hypothetical protein